MTLYGMKDTDKKTFGDEPNDTLAWVSYHLKGKACYERYKTNTLTLKGFKCLIKCSIEHVECMFKSRLFFEFKWKKLDRDRLNRLKKLLLCLETGIDYKNN